MVPYTDEVFAPVDRENNLVRVAGGNETEVYCTDDGRYAIKLKSERGSPDRATVLGHARQMRAAANAYADCLGPTHTIPSSYLIARDSQQELRVLVVQPFLHGARPLSELDYGQLDRAARRALRAQLHTIIARARAYYLATGSMPDLYGRSSKSSAERQRLNTWAMLPWRLWSFIVQRNLLRSHNLLYTSEGRVVLVDYDTVRRGTLYRRIYYLVRLLLFWRDYILLGLMERDGHKIEYNTKQTYRRPAAQEELDGSAVKLCQRPRPRAIRTRYPNGS